MASGHASSQSVIAVTVTMSAIAIALVAMRMWARLIVSRNAGKDDVCIVVSLVFATLCGAAIIVQAKTGMGHHQWNIPIEKLTLNLRAFYVSICVYNASLTATKIGILYQYLRIFSQPKRVRTYIWLLMVVVTTYGLFALLTAIWSCYPIAYFWNSSIEGGKCLDRFAIWFANAGVNIATDLALAVLPLPVLNGLQLPRRQRQALVLVFALGGFTCIVSILRLQSLYVISRTTDVSWNNGMAAIWSDVEMNIAIICSCLPTLRCVFPKIFNNQLSLSSQAGQLSHQDRGRERRRTPFSRALQSCKERLATGNESTNSATTSGGAVNSSPSFHRRQGSLEALAKSGQHGSRTVKRPHLRRRGSDSVDEIELDSGSELPPLGGIHVVTAIEQEVEKREDFDRPAEHTREYVRAGG